MQFELLGGGVQVRPNPWPSSSNCLATAGAYGLESASLLQKVHYCFALVNNLKVDLFQSSQWDSTSLFFLLISSRGNASLLTISTASWRAKNSLLHVRKVEVAHIDMTAWFIYNLVSVLVLSKQSANVGLLRITCCIEL
jgi:hypothetical protein